MGLAAMWCNGDVVELAVKDLEVKDRLATGGVSHASCRQIIDLYMEWPHRNELRQTDEHLF